jgi:hypothetical protein
MTVALCQFCKLPHDGETGCAAAQHNVMAALLKQIGQPGECSGCHAPIVWVRHKNGKQTPYTLEGLNHFIDCPKRGQFK